MGDLYRIYLIAQRDGIDYNLAYIDSDFDAPHNEEFDTAYMRRLFDYGYHLAQAGYPWEKYPPGYASTNPVALSDWIKADKDEGDDAHFP